MIRKWIAAFRTKRTQSDIRKVLFNIIDIGGFVGGVLALFISIVIGLPMIQNVAIFSADVILVIGYYIANKKNNINAAAFLIVSVVALVLFPFMFYTDGGLYGGMGYWYLLGIIFNFLLIEGLLCYVLLTLQIIVTLFCFIHTYYHPETVIALEKGDMFVDVVQSLLIAAVIIGIIVKFQNKVYKDKLKELSEMNEENEKLAKIAADANRAKSDFLAQMSHEIRTPINAVLGMNEMILRESEDEDILEYSGNIDSAGSTLLSIINSILDFSKIEDGKMEIVPVEYDMTSFINDLYQSIVQRADAKGLAFVVEVDEALPCMLLGDDVRFSQVIMNLLTNAVKYTEKGSVTLAIKVSEKRDNTISIAVSVRDTGIGIRSEDRKRLFESFERLDEVRNHGIEGTGLGISIVTNLLRMMGSRLQVESIYGKGSVFSFVIEQEIIDDTPIGDYKKRLKEGKVHKNREDILSAPGARILMVDDNDMNLKVARNLLKLCGIRPEEAISGADTIELMKNHTYDIVFLDHMMPGMDGIETLHRLKENNLVPEETVVIALTANAVVGARESYLKEGFTDYLSKPVEIHHLVEKLRKYLPERAYESAGADALAGKPEASDNGLGAGQVKNEEILEYEPVVEADGILEFDPVTDDGILEFDPVAEDDAILEFAPGDEDNTDGYGDSGTKPGYDIERLNEAGIDVATGLKYCAGDEPLYFEMLNDFAASSEGKLAELDRFFSDENWHDYEIAVHAIKSNAKMIGVSSAYEQAKKLEEAAKNENTGFIKEHHKPLIRAVWEAAGMIRTVYTRERN